MKPVRLAVLMTGVLITATSVVAISFTDAAHALTAPIVTWKKSSLLPSTSYATSALATSNSSGTKVWSVSGSCILRRGKITTLDSGSCTLRVTIKARGKFSSKSFSKRFVIVKNTSPTATTAQPGTTAPITTSPSAASTTLPPLSLRLAIRTTANGLGSNDVTDVYVVGSTVYAVTERGLSISTNGGSTFTNRTIRQGLGGWNSFNCVFATGTKVYAGMNGGLAISTDGGTTFTTRTTANGLGDNVVWDVFATGSTVYAATMGGLSISKDGGTTFTNRTTANGLSDNSVWDVFVVGSTVYVVTKAGLSISANGGASFRTATTNGDLSVNRISSVYVDGPTIYVATDGGLFISQ